MFAVWPSNLWSALHSAPSARLLYGQAQILSIRITDLQDGRHKIDGTLERTMWIVVASLLLLATQAAAQTTSLDFRAAQQSLAQTAPACVVNAAPEGERLILVGASTPTVLSDLIFDQRDEEAQVVTIDIEAGSGSLHITIFADDEMLYVVNDPTGRVVQLQLLTHPRARAGVVGLARERIQFVNIGGCNGLSLSRDIFAAAMGRDRQSEARIGAMFGRLPELIALRDARAAQVPSGTLDRPDAQSDAIVFAQRSSTTTVTVYKRDRDGTMRREPNLVYPKVEIDPELLVRLHAAFGGVQIIDPADVVSMHGVTRSSRMEQFRR